MLHNSEVATALLGTLSSLEQLLPNAHTQKPSWL